jgi:hypothetical protein
MYLHHISIFRVGVFPLGIVSQEGQVTVDTNQGYEAVEVESNGVLI